jgi:hypothetical protein
MFAMIRKKARNMTPVSHPSQFADVMHMDMIFGQEIAIGNVHYGLLFTDCYSRMTCMYPLHNLTMDIPRQHEAFFAHIGIIPKCLISDFDLKLIGGKAREYLNSLLVHINAAPSYQWIKMVLLNIIGRLWYQWLEIGFLQQSHLLHFGFTLLNGLQRFVINFLIN